MKQFLASTNVRPALATLAALAIINTSLLGHRAAAWGDTAHVTEAVHVLDATQIAGGQSVDEIYLCIGLAGLSLVTPLALLFAIPTCGGVLLGTLG